MNNKAPYYRYKMVIEYKGECFYGWQRQKISPTVQEVLEDTLAILTRQKVIIHGAGRTDTGVHALGQVAHFDLVSPINCFQIMEGLNHFLLPKGVCILSIEEVDSLFHARFSARFRSYRYIILNRQAPSLLAYPHAWHVVKPLDVNKMQEAAQLLLGQHDFTSFRDSQCQAKNPIRTLKEFSIEREGEIITAYLKAQSFLHHQVRIMMGTLKEIGVGRRNPSDIKTILEAKNRCKAGQTAPANGLFFLNVEY